MVANISGLAIHAHPVSLRRRSRHIWCIRRVLRTAPTLSHIRLKYHLRHLSLHCHRMLSSSRIQLSCLIPCSSPKCSRLSSAALHPPPVSSPRKAALRLKPLRSSRKVPMRPAPLSRPSHRVRRAGQRAVGSSVAGGCPGRCTTTTASTGLPWGWGSSGLCPVPEVGPCSPARTCTSPPGRWAETLFLCTHLLPPSLPLGL